MQPSILTLKTINELLGENFFVPSYQRGYRWSSIQVIELLTDIWDFHRKDNKTKEEFYCLQPIVIMRNADEWELIDGQQRLTTIFLILQYLKPVLDILGKKSYTIRYQTRKDSEHFLNNINLDLEDDNIDYYHFCQAYNTISDWFNTKDKTAKVNFLTTLLNPEDEGKNVKVIWYEVDHEVNAIDIFTRINIGKIPLNNAELIRALFLRQSNFGSENSKYRLQRQLQIASEWDDIEHRLQDESFWNFIYEGNKKYASRIEYIFDLMKSKNEDHEDYYTFHEFNKSFEQTNNIEALWLDIKHYFQTFNDWYNNDILFHLVGYLIATGSSVIELKENSEGRTKLSFKEYINKEICKKVSCQIDDLEYGNKLIRRILLLFNIQTIVANPNSNIRFPFDKFKNESWDIEHVRSVKSDKPLGKKQREWLSHILFYFTGKNEIEEGIQDTINELSDADKELVEKIYKLLLEDKITDDKFTLLYEEVLLFFKEDSEPESINAISNLALLDATTNRSYKNAVFPVKRARILHNDTLGIFVPICTKNLFMKSYSRRLDNVMFWQEKDSNDYLTFIKDTLAIYLPKQNTIEAYGK